MIKSAKYIGLLAAVFSFSASAQTVQIRTLDQAGAESVLQAAKENAVKRNAPSAIAVVDFAGDLLAFERMDGVRLASAELAIEKGRTAARLQRPTRGGRGQHQSRPDGLRHGGHHVSARRHAHRRQRQGGRRRRCGRQEQGDRRRHREGSGGRRWLPHRSQRTVISKAGGYSGDG